jgi:hypothetical protein
VDLDDISDHLADLDPREVERVIAVLNDLIRAVDNHTVKVYLHAVCEDLSKLLGSEDDAAWADAA